MIAEEPGGRMGPLEEIDLIWNGKITSGKVFDLTLPLDQVAAGYRAMDERRAIRRCCAREALGAA